MTSLPDVRTRPVTEAEAMEKKFCPFAFGAAEMTYCIGSACMLWRWKNLGVSGEYLHPVGYCGAGGEPS